MDKKYEITKRAIRKYASYHPVYFPLMLLQVIFKNISPYFNLWFSAEIVSALYEGRGREAVLFLVGAFLFGNLGIRFAKALFDRAMDLHGELLQNEEELGFYHKTLSLDYDKLEDPKVRLMRRRIRENSYINDYGMKRMVQMVNYQLMGSLINVLFSLLLFGEMAAQVIAAGWNWQGILLISAMIILLVVENRLNSAHGLKMTAYSKKIGDFMLGENRLSNGTEVLGTDNRMYRQQDLLDKIWKEMNAKHLKLFTEDRNKELHGQIPIRGVFMLSRLCLYLFVCFYCSLGAFPVGSLIKYVGCLGRLTGSLGSLFLIPSELKENEPYLKDYLDYFDVANDLYQGELAVEKRSDKKFEIEFRNVGLRYSGMEDYALRHINLKLKVGERLAVVGMNGSGKTTFIKLLCRLYDPSEGEIIMNDFNIRKYDYRQYLDLFSVVFQDYKLLSLPLGNNVSCESSWDERKAERLLREVGFGERYDRLEKKLDTPLYRDFDEDGVNVSGGEAQKIALARALYKDAPFIILDEPTAALDPVAEAEIYARFDEIVGDKTAIYISHRLASCRFCDKIAVFDQGKIIQVGTHEELLADVNGKYYELWNAQAQYYTKAENKAQAV